jgi:ribosomal protein L37E
VLTVGKRAHRFAKVPHERCERCGERIFGIEASKRFDAALLKGRGRRAA